MRRILPFILTAFASYTAVSQTILQSEDFTTYLGTSATVPSGWAFSYNGNYTTTASSGTSGPNSYKFGVNNATITSPMFSNADTLSFWVKGNGTDVASKLVVLESANNVTYDTIAKMDSLPTNATGQTFKFPLMPASQYIRFVYVKSVGNAAFDDYRILQNVAVPTSVSADFMGENACIGDSTHFMDMSTGTGGPITSYVWNFDDASTSTAQNPVHLYAAPGGYEVTLTVIDSSLNTDTFTDSVYVYEKPIATFTAPSTVCGTMVQFVDGSSISSGTIGSYTWNFGDSLNNISSLQNPTHTFSASGIYTVAEVVTSNMGCKDTVSAMITNTIVTATLSASEFLSSEIFNGSGNGGSAPYSYILDFGDGTSPSTNPNVGHTYPDGTYTACLTVTDNNGCADSSCVTFTLATGVGIAKYNGSNFINITPNPSTDGFLIVNANNSTKGTLTVHNILGKVIVSKQILEGKTSIDLSAEANGSYFVTIKTDKQVITKKIIINK